MGLQSFFSEPFTSASQIDQVDTFTTTNSTTYSVVNKTIDRIGAKVQYSNVIKDRYNGGFSIGTNSIILDSVPVSGLQGVIPGQGVNFSSYDNTNVSPTGNVDERTIYFGNISTINVNMYKALAGQPGIALTINNLITSVGPDLSWVQIACSLADGTAATYQATGTTLYTPDLKAFSTIAASGPFYLPASSSYPAGINMITVAATANPSDFWAGDFIVINFGQTNAEIQHMSAITVGATSTILTLSGSTNFSHLVGETVYACMRKFWLRETTPLGYTNNQASNYYNLSTYIQADELVRP